MTLFLSGDKFTRQLTAKNANRLLRAAQESEAGAGNLTTSDIQRAWDNNHLLVKWTETHKYYAGSLIGIGNPLQGYTYSNLFREIRPRYAQELLIYPGQRFKIKKHWFRYGVLQATAQRNEIVPVAVSGNTMAFVNSANMQEGGRIDLHDVAQDNFTNALYNYFNAPPIDFGAHFGHAILLKGSGRAIPKSRALVRLNDRNTVWRALLTNRLSTNEFEGFLPAYGTPISDIKIFDPFQLMPSTSDLPVGSVGVTVGVEITQKIQVISGEVLPDITGYIVSVIRGTTLTGVELSVPPI